MSGLRRKGYQSKVDLIAIQGGWISIQGWLDSNPRRVDSNSRIIWIGIDSNPRGSG